MRIALLGHHVAPIRPPFVGGVESFTWYLARWLATAGHEVTLFAAPGTDVPGVDVRPVDFFADAVGHRARADVSMPPEAFMAAHHAYQGLMIDLAADAYEFDLIHSHSLHYLPVAMAPLLSVPLLLTLHTPPTPWLQSALATSARRGCAPLASAVSEPTRRIWQEVLPVAATIPNGVDLGHWRPGPGSPGRATAAWYGRIVPEKAPHLAIDAARIAGVPLHLAGPVIDRAYWSAEVEPRLGPGARYLGHLGHGELAELAGSSSVVLQTPTWEEPFGLAAAEAIATGTPVAAFSRGGLPDVVSADAGRLALPGDAADLARALREAIEMPRADVRAYAERELGLDAMGRRYEALYDDVAVVA